MCSVTKSNFDGDLFEIVGKHCRLYMTFMCAACVDNAFALWALTASLMSADHVKISL